MLITITSFDNMDNILIGVLYAPNEKDMAHQVGTSFEHKAREAGMFKECRIGTESIGLIVQSFHNYEDIDYIDDNIVRDGIANVFEFDEYDLSLQYYTDRMIVRELYW